MEWTSNCSWNPKETKRQRDRVRSKRTRESVCGCVPSLERRARSGPGVRDGIHRTQCRLSLSSRVASVRYTLTQRGRGEHLFWKFTQTHNPHHLILDSVDTVVDPRRKGRYERWESRRSALARRPALRVAFILDSRIHTLSPPQNCACVRCEFSHPVPHPAHRALVACMCAPKVHEEHLSFDTIDGSCTVHDIQFTHKYLEV